MVLQGPLGRDKQSLVAKLVCDRPQRHLAQRRSMSPVLRIGFSHTGAIFLWGLAESALAGAEVVVHKVGGALQLCTSGQLATRERAPRRDPQVAPLVA